ncbi:zinc finger CCCH domain-containing protein 15 homolog [Arctopsyche grandis]|uniref:zinc finger CCCH domain-containing protein 15 homolog n=1 Tax=Arctopsyche grandis TaxID=121162 RepID=UPI00406D98FB
MAKPQAVSGKPIKTKSAKDVIKELEGKMFGEKNKAKKKEIQGMIKKLELEIDLEKKKKAAIEMEKKTAVVKQLIPVGVDPKTVHCVNFLNGNCDKGDSCQFGHNLKKEDKKEKEIKATNQQKVVCRFLIDAMNKGEFSNTWVCPIPKCSDIHKLIELSNNQEVEISLEEYIELQRLTLNESDLTPVTDITFAEWKMKRDKEEALHAKRVAALSCKGADLFLKNPEMFEDDEEVGDEINYNERNYELLEEDEPQQEKLSED